MDPRLKAPRCNPLGKAPAHNEESCQVVQWPQGEARALPAPPHQDRAPPMMMARECQDQAPPPWRATALLQDAANATL